MYKECYLHVNLNRVYIFDSENNTWVNFEKTLHKQHIKKIATYLFKKRKKSRFRDDEIMTTRFNRFNRAVNECVVHERAARFVYIKSELHVKTISKNTFKTKTQSRVLLIALFNDMMLADDYTEHYSMYKSYDIYNMHDK